MPTATKGDTTGSGPLAHSVTFQGSEREADEVARALAERLRQRGAVVRWTVQRPGCRAALLSFPNRAQPVGALTVSLHEDQLRQRDGEYVASLTIFSGGPRVDLLEIVDRLPFTATELEQLGAAMPVTVGFPSRTLDETGSEATPMVGLSAILTIHHQTDFLVLMDIAKQLGIDLTNSLVVDKQYRYEKCARVDATIDQVFHAAVVSYGEIDDGVKRFIEQCRLERRRVIVFDDGGYVYPVLANIFASEPRLQQYVIGIVEQTQSGIWKLDSYASHKGEAIRLPIFSVAESDVKATVESHGVASAGFRALRQLMPHEKFTGRRAIVSGYGRIGSALAEVLRRERVVVGVFDPRRDRLVSAHEDGFFTAEDLPRFVREFEPHFFFGCAGRDSAVGEVVLSSFSRDCVLVSTTSRDFEFDKAAMLSIAQVVRTQRLGTTYEVASSGARLTLVADGFPINFYYAESMPNGHSDLIMACLLFGGAVLASERTGFKLGHNVVASNNLLNTSSILSAYYDAHK